MSPRVLHFAQIRKLFSTHTRDSRKPDRTEADNMLAVEVRGRHAEPHIYDHQHLAEERTPRSLDTVRRLVIPALDGESRSYPPSKIRTRASNQKIANSASSVYPFTPHMMSETRPTVAISPPMTPTSTNSTSSYTYDSSPQALSNSVTSYSASGRTTPIVSTETQRRFSTNAPQAHVVEIAATAPDTGLKTITEIGSSFYSLCHDPWTGPTVAKVTIRTVENAAAAQAYLESFYNSLSTTHADGLIFDLDSSDTNEQLRSSGLPLQDQQTNWRKWPPNESSKLRRVRLQKSKMLQDKKQVRESLGGFEIVRVLGKGSFGVVRLVRETTVTSESPFHGKLVNGDYSSTGGLPRCVENPETAPVVQQSCSEPKVWAMKAIRKSDMLRNSQEGHLRAERDLLAQAISAEWIVPLMASFQDKHNLYLVMDYMVGGDFLGYLVREDVLDERDTAFWIAEMILCVEEVHNMGWIHRDVKPDNFLIGADGHLKIADFGLSFDGHWAHDQMYYTTKRIELCRRLDISVSGDRQDKLEEEDNRSRARMPANSHSSPLDDRPDQKHKYKKPTKTIAQLNNIPVLQALNEHGKRRLAVSGVGTSQYMAPEIVRGEPYDGRCDWWSVGIILYECLYGRTPFFDESRQKTKDNISEYKDRLKFPDMIRRKPPTSECCPEEVLAPVTNHAIDLMRRLLSRKRHRLCCAQYQVNDITPSSPGLRKSRGPRIPGSKGRGTASIADVSRELEKVQCFVHPQGATDIKRHPFFALHGIEFEFIHKQMPPWIPSTDGDKASTLWFEDEKNIIQDDDISLDSDSDSYVSEDDACPTSPTEDSEIGSPLSRADACHMVNGMAIGMYDAASPYLTSPALLPVNVDRNGKERKRARDKILRDPEHGTVALHYRKKRAFLGYTWRRPDLGARSTLEVGMDLKGKRIQTTRQSTRLPAEFLDVGMTEASAR